MAFGYAMSCAVQDNFKWEKWGKGGLRGKVWNDSLMVGWRLFPASGKEPDLSFCGEEIVWWNKEFFQGNELLMYPHSLW